MSDRADHTERDLLVQAYLDGDADAAGRVRVENDPDLLVEVRAHEQLRDALRRPLDVDPARREHVLAAALDAFEERRAPAPPTPPPPVPLAARRRGRWLIPAAAALAVVAGGAVVATVVSTDSDSDETTAERVGEPTRLSLDDEPEAAATTAIAGGTLSLLEAAPASEAADSAAASASSALPRISSAEELGAFAAGVMTEPTADAAGEIAAPEDTTAARGGAAVSDIGNCGDDVIALAELVDGELIRPVAVRVEVATDEVVALDAETCDEVLRAPMP